MFKNAKVGDRAWFFEYGWGTITHVFKDSEYPINFESDTKRICNFTIDGKRAVNDINPTLFWDEIKFEIPEKPFNLEDELRRLEIKEFTSIDEVFYLEWDWSLDILTYSNCRFYEKIGCIYFEKAGIAEFVNLVNKHNITKEEFFTAYKNVFGGKNAD